MSSSDWAIDHTVSRKIYPRQGDTWGRATKLVTTVRINDMDRTDAMAPLQGYFEQYTLDDRIYRSGSLTFHADPEMANRGIIEAGLLKDFDGVGDLPLTVKMFLYDAGIGGTYIDNDPIVLAEIEKRGVVQ